MRRSALMLLLLGFAGAANAQVQKPCAWLFEPTADRENILFPELTTRYLAAVLPALPAGGAVEIAGQYPHARYISLQTYGGTLQTISNLNDGQILPDPGSLNPFLPGADRTVLNRSYTVRVLNEPMPATGGPPNTLYYQSTDGLRRGNVVVYRIYVPDAGTDRFGDVPAPSLTEVLPDGTRIPVPVCPDVVPDTMPLTQALAQAGAEDYPAPPVGLMGRAQPEWRKYVNAPVGYTDMFTNNEVLASLNQPLRDAAMMMPAGLGENADNKYVYTGLSREFGEVALIQARIPVTPRTFQGAPVMDGGQMRFWSMCTGNRTSQGYDCLFDEQVPLDAGGSYAIAVSVAGIRPQNATPECGIGWLAWGPDVTVSMIMRNMLPDAGFTQSVQAADQGTERATLGPFYPTVTYYATAADFEAAVGCHAPAYVPAATPRAGTAGDGEGSGGMPPAALALLLALAALRGVRVALAR